MEIEPFTIGMGDRFAHQGLAQLGAVVQANALGVEVVPVWNKSNREHSIIGTKPDSLRAEADAAVRELDWDGSYYVDADHINLGTVDGFIAASNFFTIDVADYVDRESGPAAVEEFVERWAHLEGGVSIAGISSVIEVPESAIEAAAAKFLAAISEAGRIYRHIRERKGERNFVVEISVDETDTPQTPVELLLILAMIADEEIPVQTIAPRFSGQFNKGIDYVGDLSEFERNFEQDLCVVAHAVREFGLPRTLKLSVHSGSDKFSLYPIINRLIRKHSAGLHLKTAGTTWLEEVIGLAEADSDGLSIAKGIYRTALPEFDSLVAPYATVVQIDRTKLPSAVAVDSWSSAEFVAALRHDPTSAAYNPHFRQLLHVAFKVAAQMGPRFTAALERHAEIIGRNVSQNLLDRHIIPLFQGARG